MEKLRSVYEKVKNHPFRVDRIGNPRSYGEVIIELAEALEVTIANQFLNGKISIDLAYNVGHDFCAIGYHFNGHGDSIKSGRRTAKELEGIISHDVRIVERYLHQVHVYIDTGIFIQWEGFYLGCNPHPGWYTVSFNPETKEFKHIKWVEDVELTRYGKLKDEAEPCPKCGGLNFALSEVSSEGWKYKCDDCNYIITKQR